MLDSNDPFYSSKFSVEWAEAHIAEFERESNKFFQPDVYKTFVEPDPDTSDGPYNFFKFKLAKSMPIALDGHVIDIVYNLRAALDQALYAVASLNNTLSLKGTPYFPIRTEKADFENGLNGVRKFFPQDITDLVCAFEPYQGGNDLLLALHKLCNTNKHGIIRPLPLATASMAFSGTAKGRGPQIFQTPVWDRSKNEMILGRVPVNAEYTFNFDYSFFIVFDDVELIAGQPVGPTLEAFLEIVQSFVMVVEAETRRLGLM